MIRRLAVLAGIGLAGPAAADPASRIIEIVAEGASEQASSARPAPTKLEFLRSQSCGSAANSYLCGTAGRQGFIDYSVPSRGAAQSRAASISGPLGGRVVVTWVGTVYCELSLEPNIPEFGTDPRYVAAVVNVQLQANQRTAVTPNGDGSATAGFQRSTIVGGARTEVPDFQIYPISLTRVFTKARSTAETYFAAIDFEIRRGIGRCNVNGGTLTALIVR